MSQPVSPRRALVERHTDGAVTIIGTDGAPLKVKPQMASCPPNEFANAPYDAADIYSGQMESWRPFLWSPDNEINIYRDRIVARVRDLVRNDGWASGAVTRILDSAVGACFRPVSKPDYRWLQMQTGNKAFDHKWANEFGRALDSCYRAWANDTGKWCDVERNLTMPQILRVGFRHKLIDGDALAQVKYVPRRIAPGKARYATSVLLIDPDRLSNPQQVFDQADMRGGVQLDADGAAEGYWIRQAHAGDWFSAGKSVRWDLIPRETSWGRPIIVHDFEHDRAGQHRGGVGIFAPVLRALKMMIKHSNVELEAAIINAFFGAWVESPFDPEMVEEAMGDKLPQYQQERTNFHKENRIKIGETNVPILFPGEKVSTLASARVTAAFKEFQNVFLRNVATGTGMATMELSNDWSDVNYSSARGALLVAWKTLRRRREEYAIGFANPIRMAHVEEVMEVEKLPLPAGAPAFLDARDAYCRCTWIGPGRGWVDPVAEKEGAVLGMEAGLGTLENEAAESSGEDWEDLLDQRKIENDGFRERGLEPPSWLNSPKAQRGGSDSGSHDPNSPTYRSR